MEYPHFILGYTTKDEYDRLKDNCSAPYFDLEVWSYGVLISGARQYAERFSYDELYKAATLWEKISQVTTTGSNQGIVFLFEPFVAAGAAVAFPGRSSVNCPEGWMPNALDYNLMVTSGAWGNFHEYHHNFQGFGVGNGGEVTNNSMTLVSYALFTKISSSRAINNFGAGSLSGWNAYTSATWALEETLKIARPNENPGNGNQGLALYATLLHNFGPNNFIQAKVAGGGQSYAAYMNAWQNVTHNNMYYYFNDILKGTGISDNADSSYPVFVPVSCVYQTGRSFIYDGEKKYFKTMQPYLISSEEPFTIDLSKYSSSGGQYQSGSIVIPDGFSYRVKSITQPAHGSIEITDTGVTYTPDSNDKSTTSGQIIVTLSITKDDGKFKVEDVDLVLEFQLTKELNKSTLERTTYTYSSENMYADATTAYQNSFNGYESAVEKANHSNPTQNANTDIWFYPDNQANREKYPDAPESYFVHDNTIEVIDGKLYCPSDGKFRVYLRGRINCALYFSPDGKDYKLGAKITKDSPAINNTATFRPNDSNTYFDVEYDAGKVTVTVNVDGGNTYKYTLQSKNGSTIVNWLYIKEVLIVQSSPMVSYIGVGMKQWDKTQYNITKEYFDANGRVVTENDNYEYTKTTYRSGNNVVAVEEVHNNGTARYQITDGSALVDVTEQQLKEFVETPVLTNQPYINAYRNSYEFPDNSSFESDYFFKRSYNYNYTDNELQNTEQTIVSSNYSPATNSSWGGYPFDIEKLIDGNRSTWIHTRGNVSESAPLEFVIDMGSAKPVDRMNVFSQNRGDLQVPKAFKLYGSLDGTEFFEVYEETDATASAAMTFEFEQTTFRYFKLVITKSSGGYIILSEIEMWKTFEVNAGELITPDNRNLIFTGDWKVEQAFSSFGHVYVGDTNAKLTFDFVGTRVGILSSSAFGKNFEVYIDGNKVNSIKLKQDSGALTYLCDALGSGTHHVEIKCTAQANIDSIVIFR